MATIKWDGRPIVIPEGSTLTFVEVNPTGTVESSDLGYSLSPASVDPNILYASLTSGTYSGTISVSLTCEDPTAKIYYLAKEL